MAKRKKTKGSIARRPKKRGGPGKASARGSAKKTGRPPKSARTAAKKATKKKSAAVPSRKATLKGAAAGGSARKRPRPALNRAAAKRTAIKRPAAKHRAPRRRAPPTVRRRRSNGWLSKRRDVGGMFLRFAANAGFFVFTGAIVVAAFIAMMARDLPSTDGLWHAGEERRITLVAADGAPIPLRGEAHGDPVRLSDLPPYVPGAILAIEDRNFYHHVGVNPFAVIRAAWVNLRAGALRQGGSSITQQLARNLFLSSDKTIKRKIQELLLAFWLEARFSKDEILTLYLNRVYFGAGAYGVEAASFRYFGKSASNLAVNEAALLAGLLKAPTKLSPEHNPEEAGARARLVMQAMTEAGVINAANAEEAAASPVRLVNWRSAAAPYFSAFANREARRRAKASDVDLTVRTTLDPTLQNAMEMGIKTGIAQARVGPNIEVAAVMIDGAGAVRAMVGGRHYARSQFNRATDARRQPGSAFKTFTYLAALEAGARPKDKIKDKPLTIMGWRPRNYNDQYLGAVTLESAFGKSLNTAAIRLQEKVGREDVRRTAKRMGIESALSTGGALSLGVDVVTPLELAGAYAPLVNGGYRVDVHGITDIDDGQGEALYHQTGSFEEAAASKKSLARLNKMLAYVVNEGTGKAASLDHYQAYGKTGTTQGHRDAWFVGHAGGLVMAVWVGRDDNGPMTAGQSGVEANVTGGGVPAIIWREVMNRALDVRPPFQWRTEEAALDLETVNVLNENGAAIEGIEALLR